MANNYILSSSFLPLPEGKINRAQEIVDTVLDEMTHGDDEDGYCGCQVTVEEDGVWFSHDETINPEHVERLARALVEGLEIDEPFYCSWAYTCSKSRVDQFGGGAFAVRRGADTYWVDAMSHVRELATQGT